MRFSKYKTTKELWAAILKTFGGNKATKKRKKNLLKQQYGNFNAEGSETLEQTFNRLQVIVSQLQFMDVEVEKDDLNQKFLTSLAPEWLMYTIVWINRNDLDTMSLDDLYNQLKVYEAEVQMKSNSNSQNMAFISSSKNSSGNEDGNIACVSTSSTIFPTASASVATISQDTASTYIASQSNGSQIKFEDINQIDEDDMEEMDIKWNMALLSIRADKFWKRTGKKISIQGSDVAGFDKSKVECFNCHKMGHFARECRAPRNQERGRKESYRQRSKAEEKNPKALMAIDGVGWDWSYMANEGEDHALVADAEAPTEFALMANTESNVFDNSLCSNDCKKNNNSLNSKIKDLTGELSKANNYIYHYKLAVAQLEGRLVKYKKREVKYIEKIRTLEMYRASNLKCIKTLDKELEEFKLEKDGLDGKLAGLLKASKNLDNLIESQRSDKKDLSWTGLPEFVDDTVTDYSRPSPTIESTSAEGPEFVLNKKACYNCGNFSHLANDCRKRVQRETSRSQNHAYMGSLNRFAGHKPHGAPMRPPHKSVGHRPRGPLINPIRPNMNVKTQYKAPWVSTVNRNNPPVNRKFSTGRRNFPTVNRKFPTASRKFTTGSTKIHTADMGKKGKAGSSQNNIDDKGYWDSGCARRMTGNISHLSNFEPFNGGYVSFGQGGCKITGKGTIKSDSECIVLGRNFKLLDDANILLRTPR
nr:hypothetical protein [Tanacetum cinerariifolium]